MGTQRKRSALSYIPGYSNNAVLQLIIASGVAFVMLGVTWGIIKIVYQGDETPFNTYFIANIALPTLANFTHHWWTIFTYGWFHFNGFMELLSNMLWLYCFGSVVQMLVGHKQIIPLYIYSLVAGGIFYLAIQLLPGTWNQINYLGCRAGLMGLAAASVTLTPKYRFYLTDRFSVPLLAVAGVFALVTILGTPFYAPALVLLLAGAVTGFVYIKSLQAGYRPGAWMYSVTRKIAGIVTPDEEAISKKRNWDIRDRAGSGRVSQGRVDDILDKINQKGYNALSTEEKEILKRAGKE